MRSIVKSLRTIAFCAAVVFVACPSVSFATLDSTYKFEMNISGVSSFGFRIGAAGTFYVDCGGTTTVSIFTGGPPGITVTSQGTGKYMITQTLGAVSSSNGLLNFVCNYSDASSSRTISVGGEATGYYSGNNQNNLAYPAFKVSVNQSALTSVSGDLSAVFPILSTGTDTEPLFTGAFDGCSNLTWIPASMFYGYRNSAITNNSTWTNIFAGTGTPKACPAGYTDVTSNYYSGYSSYWNSMPACETSSGPTYDFTITTTNLSFGDQFKFKIGAGGTFYVDCGTDGILYDNSDNPISNGTIVKSADTTSGSETVYYCGYNSGGVKTVQFGGRATSYATVQSIGFGDGLSPALVAGISGSLGAIFPTLSSTQLPRFWGTFKDCVNLTGTIPPTLFGYDINGVYYGVSGSASTMFRNTFYNCKELTGSIPGTLFGREIGGVYYGISGGASHMFEGTFFGCKKLIGEIPANLFVGITNGGSSMFYQTFAGCKNLGRQYVDGVPFYTIPATLFANLSGNAWGLFYETFSGCGGLAGPIPADLFRGISGHAANMFNGTFYNCVGLTGPIPPTLFGREISGVYYGVSGNDASMFTYTFAGCSGLTGPIPPTLFGREISGVYYGVSGNSSNMFSYTFYGCSRLTGEIPSTLFGREIGGVHYGISGSNSGMFNGTFWSCTNLGKDGVDGTSTYFIPYDLFAEVSGSSASSMFYNTFLSTGLLQCCPAGKRRITSADSTNYNIANYVDNNGTMNGRVSCIADTPPAGETTWVYGACVTNCGKQLNVKPDNAGQTKAYFMYKRTGTLVGDKTLNIKESGATDTCYVPLKSVNNAPSGEIQGVLRISVNGNTYYAEPAN